MIEDLRYPISPFIVGKIENVTPFIKRLEFLFITPDGQMLHSSDTRFNDFKDFAEEWKPEKRSPSGNIFTLFSPKRISILVFDFKYQNQIEVHSGQNHSYAYTLGSQADFWFKEPWIEGFDSKIQKPIYKPGTQDLRVVAQPIFHPI